MRSYFSIIIDYAWQKCKVKNLCGRAPQTIYEIFRKKAREIANMVLHFLRQGL